MSIVLLFAVGSVACMAIGLACCLGWLFAPGYEHRNPFLGQPDVRLDSRFEKLWNKRQDEIERRNRK